MSLLEVHAVRALPVARLQTLGSRLLARAAAEPMATLAVVELRGDALLLGRFQRARSAIRKSTTLDLHRRLGGGRTVRAGDGVLAVLLALPTAGFLSGTTVGPEKV